MTITHDAINGIRNEISGQELCLAERIRMHHEGRADALGAQPNTLTEAEREVAVELANVLGRYESPRAALAKKFPDHRDRASYLAFIRDRIVADQRYRLNAADLRITEILPDKPW